MQRRQQGRRRLDEVPGRGRMDMKAVAALGLADRDPAGRPARILLHTRQAHAEARQAGEDGPGTGIARAHTGQQQHAIPAQQGGQRTCQIEGGAARHLAIVEFIHQRFAGDNDSHAGQVCGQD
ncbi:hypothetical protein PEC18_17580 [Paucibacter sp. O1-1]|nr:hypothetical protein [Paucibacter sp. O1-1]MDA3827610.1 hypothetical protein [Paucibacter sp. O1-1]